MHVSGRSNLCVDRCVVTLRSLLQEDGFPSACACCRGQGAVEVAKQGCFPKEPRGTWKPHIQAASQTVYLRASFSPQFIV